MEYKKKTLIWEDNNEPPKNYIWIKSDGKPYEYDYIDRIWKESKSISTDAGSGSGSNVELLTLNVTENGEYTPDKGKAYNKVNVNVQGGGTFNINDIILADDLLEKCQALGLEAGDSIDTDWTFEDICTQDSCGILQYAFESVVCRSDPEYPEDWETVNGILVFKADMFTTGGRNIQKITLSVPNSAAWFEITYNPNYEKYVVELKRPIV